MDYISLEDKEALIWKLRKNEMQFILHKYFICQNKVSVFMLTYCLSPYLFWHYFKHCSPKEYRFHWLADFKFAPKSDTFGRHERAETCKFWSFNCASLSYCDLACDTVQLPRWTPTFMKFLANAACPSKMLITTSKTP
jgi:hypothetical protein